MHLDYARIVVLAIGGAVLTEAVKRALAKWEWWTDFIPLILVVLMPAGGAAVAYFYGGFWVDGLLEGLIVAAGSIMGWSVVAKTISGAQEVLASLGDR